MKVLFITVCLGLFSLSSFACDPAPQANNDVWNINRSLESDSFRLELNKQMNGDYNLSISKVDLVKGQVRVRLSNKCSIMVKTTWLAPEYDGMCPRIDKIIAKTDCD